MDKTHILSRISRDGAKAIVREGKSFRAIDLSTREYSSDAKSLGALIASGSWRRPTAEEKTSFALVEEPVVSEEEAAEILSAEETDDLEMPADIYEFNDEYDFFATPYEGSQDSVDGVYALDPETGDLYYWVDGTFTAVGEQSLDPSIPESWILVDAETAQFIADWKDHGTEQGSFVSIYGNDPAEKELFDSAESSEDWEFIDSLSAVVADASGYSPVERSRNASKQRRGPGGRFARSPGKSPSAPANEETENSEVLRTYIPSKRDLKLLPNPLNFIVDFIGSASPSGGPSLGGGVGVAASGELPEVSKEAQDATREESIPSPDAVYFAIVHRNDNKAVQNLIAITKSEAGAPQAWNRNGGEWKLSPDVLADLQSVTPPPVVQLDEATAKIVMEGVDKFDTENPNGMPGENPEGEEPVQASGMSEKIRKGYALRDGSFLIRDANDLFTAVQFAPEDASFEVKNHIVKRARALNRMDVVPAEWRTLSAISDSPLFNSYGEVIIAAGGNGGNAETLRQYWSEGKGAAKVRWGTEGDLTRCHRKLSKYMPGRAWGYCQNLHQRKYGVSNYKKDNG